MARGGGGAVPSGLFFAHKHRRWLRLEAASSVLQLGRPRFKTRLPRQPCDPGHVTELPEPAASSGKGRAGAPTPFNRVVTAARTP